MYLSDESVNERDLRHMLHILAEPQYIVCIQLVVYLLIFSFPLVFVLPKTNPFTLPLRGICYKKNDTVKRRL